MELIVILALLLAVAALSTLLLLRRSQGSQPGEELAPRPAAEAQRAGGSVEVAGSDERAFVLADGSGRELYAEIIEPGESILFTRGDAHQTHRASSVALDKALESIPYIGAAVAGGKWVRILNPEVLAAGEQMRSKSGGLLGGVLGANKRLAAQLRFTSPQDLAQLATPLGVFKVAAAVTGQYYLNAINSQLIAIEGQVRQIRQELRNETYGEITAAAEACVELEEGLALSYDLTGDERIRLVNAEGTIDKAYKHKRKDCEDFIADVEKLFASKTLDRDEAERLLSEASSIRAYDAQLLTYAAAVRHKLNVLRAQVDLDADGGRGRLAQEKLERELQEMRRDLFAAVDAIGKLAITREEAADVWEFGFARKPPRLFDGFAEQGKATHEELAAAPAKLLPTPSPAPMILEAYMGDDGLVQILAATPEPEPVTVEDPGLVVGDAGRKRARLAVLRSRRQYRLDAGGEQGLEQLDQQIAAVEFELEELGRIDERIAEDRTKVKQLRQQL